MMDRLVDRGMGGGKGSTLDLDHNGNAKTPQLTSSSQQPHRQQQQGQGQGQGKASSQEKGSVADAGAGGGGKSTTNGKRVAVGGPQAAGSQRVSTLHSQALAKLKAAKQAASGTTGSSKPMFKEIPFHHSNIDKASRAPDSMFD